jgi:septum formation protein
VIAEGGRAGLAPCRSREMHVRPLSEKFIAEEYLDANGPRSRLRRLLRIEGPGVQLFSRTEGSQFTILGMPLLPMLDYLRTRGILTS